MISCVVGGSALASGADAPSATQRPNRKATRRIHDRYHAVRPGRQRHSVTLSALSRSHHRLGDRSRRVARFERYAFTASRGDGWRPCGLLRTHRARTAQRSPPRRPRALSDPRRSSRPARAARPRRQRLRADLPAHRGRSVRSEHELLAPSRPQDSMPAFSSVRSAAWLPRGGASRDGASRGGGPTSACPASGRSSTCPPVGWSTARS